MPNYCYNALTVVGEKEIVDLFVQLNKGDNGDIDFSQLAPYPDEIYQGNLGQEERKIHGANNWYDWNIANWGTKWNASEIEEWVIEKRYDDIYTASIKFTTAWAPPIEWFKKAAPQYSKSLSFTLDYWEEGMFFAGTYRLNAALDAVEEETYNYWKSPHVDVEENLENLRYEVEEYFYSEHPNLTNLRELFEKDKSSVDENDERAIFSLTLSEDAPTEGLVEYLEENSSYNDEFKGFVYLKYAVENNTITFTYSNQI